MDDEDQAAAELDQILARRKSRAAASGAKIRMPDSDINFIMSLQRSNIPSDDDDTLDYLSRRNPDRYTPEVVEKLRREHKELVAMFRRDDEEIEARQAEIMREVGEKGYVEADEIDQTYIDEVNEWTRVQWEKLGMSSERLRLLRIADEENDEAFRSFLIKQAEEAEEEEDYYGDEDDDDASTFESSE
jgi:hypothetical protein